MTRFGADTWRFGSDGWRAPSPSCITRFGVDAWRFLGLSAASCALDPNYLTFFA
ncbi:MAG: hypothetical protein FWE94_03930 [Coriobacteriia bacterium]|nr:hypothetical protein [Coriobacteriia bacterium]